MDGEDILWLLIVGGIISLLVVVLISFLAGNTAVNLLESVGLEQGAGPVGAAVSLVAFVWIAAGILKLIFGNL